MMKKLLIALFVLALGVGGYWGGAYFTNKAMNNLGTVAEQVSATKQPRENVTGQENVLTLTDSQGTVVIQTTLMLAESSNSQLVFEIVMNTHSVDLNQYDLTRIANLSFESTSALPGSFSWESSNNDTHHKLGYLKWSGTTPKDISALTLELEGIDEIPSRTFTWDQKEYLDQIVLD